MSKRQEMREKRRRQEITNRIIAIVAISLGALLLAFLFIWPNLKPVGDIIVPDSNPRPQANFNTMGDPNAPIRITEYSDFQCPFCAKFWKETEGRLVETYIATGVVYFEYRSFGGFIGRESARAAEAAYCAGDQNKYWEMHDIIFGNLTGENVGAFTDRRLEAFAEKLGLDMTAFNDCFSSGKHAGLVEQDGLDGQKAGIKATPSFVLTYTDASGQVQTVLLEGALPFSTFQTEIEKALAAAAK
jgi:protein-disulfide isomerase